MIVRFYATTIDTNIKLSVHFNLTKHNMVISQIEENVTRISDGCFEYDVFTDSIEEI